MALSHMRTTGHLVRAVERMREIEDGQVFHGNNNETPLYNT